MVMKIIGSGAAISSHLCSPCGMLGLARRIRILPVRHMGMCWLLEAKP